MCHHGSCSISLIDGQKRIRALKRQHAALLTSAQMLDADRLTVATSVSKIRLMANARLPVAQAAMER